MLVSVGGFSLENISFLLFLDTENSSSCENASGMRYHKEIMLYWIFGWLMFHEKWLIFNRGIKFSGFCQGNDSKRDFHAADGGKTRINFAVPSYRVNRNFVQITWEFQVTCRLEVWKTGDLSYQMVLRRRSNLLFRLMERSLEQVTIHSNKMIINESCDILGYIEIFCCCANH